MRTQTCSLTVGDKEHIFCERYCLDIDRKQERKSMNKVNWDLYTVKFWFHEKVY